MRMHIMFFFHWLSHDFIKCANFLAKGMGCLLVWLEAMGSRERFEVPVLVAKPLHKRTLI
jgi:hypothetical protein